jgi:hypothetical protein
MKHEQRPQGFVAASAAQFRQDQAAGDCTPSNETEDDADKKQICARMTDPPGAAFIGVAIICIYGKSRQDLTSPQCTRSPQML